MWTMKENTTGRKNNFNFIEKRIISSKQNHYYLRFIFIIKKNILVLYSTLDFPFECFSKDGAFQVIQIACRHGSDLDHRCFLIQ